MFHLRPINPDTDFERIAELMRLILPNYTAQMLEDEWSAKDGSLNHYTLGCDEAGRIAGVSLVYCRSVAQPNAYRIVVIVDLEERRHGLGSMLYENAQRFALDRGGEKLSAFVWDNCEVGIRFAKQRGFTYVNSHFTSRLDVAGFDEALFAGVIERVQAQVIVFTTLADFGDTEAARRKCFELNNRSMEPAFEGAGSHAWPSFEVFTQRVCESSWYRSDGQIIAIDKSTSEWIGLGAIGFETDGVTAFNAYTGVDPRYRRRGIALALKLLGVRCARRHGYATLRANNATLNAPMLTINDKLGYARLGAILYYERNLKAGAKSD